MKKIFNLICLLAIVITQLNAQTPSCVVNTNGGTSVLTQPQWASGYSTVLQPTNSGPNLIYTLPSGNYTNGVSGFGIALFSFRCDCVVNGVPINPQPAPAVFVEVISNGVHTYFHGGEFGTPITLKPGINNINVRVHCTPGGLSGPLPPNAQPGTYFNVSITLNPPMAATITNECHYTLTGPQNSAVYTRNQMFKVKFSALPPSATTVQLFKNNVLVETLAANPPALNTDYFFTNNNTGYGNGSYKIKFIHNGVEIFPSGSTSTYTKTYSYTSRTNPCLRLVNIGVKPNLNTNGISASLLCTGNGDCPAGKTCVNGVCQ